MRLTVFEAIPQTGKWSGATLSPGESINMTDLGRSYTLPQDPHCVLCEKPFRDGDEVTVMISAHQSDIRHTSCWLDSDGTVHSD